MAENDFQLDKIDNNFKISSFGKPTEDIYDEEKNQELLEKFLSLEEKIVKDDD